MEVSELPFDMFSRDFDLVVKQYSEVVDWLDSINLPYSKTRFGNYKRNIEDFPLLFERKVIDVSDFEKKLKFYIRCFSEVTEIIRIYNEYKERVNIDYIDQLKKTMSGQPFRHTSKKDPARDFAFELTIGARFIRGDFVVELNHQADIIASNSEVGKVYVECKRIKSSSKFDVNIKKANNQLKKRLQQSRSKLSKGLVAINLTDIINPDNNMVIMREPAHIQQQNSIHLNEFIVSQEEKIRSGAFSKSMGVLSEYTTGGLIVKANKLSIVNCRGAAIYQYSNTDHAMKSFYSPLSKCIANQNL